MIPDIIHELMARQRGHVVRPSGELGKIPEALRRLGLEGHEQWESFFSRYALDGVIAGSGKGELLDLVSPNPEIENSTEFGRDTYEVKDDFVCLTTGEGEGFYLYCKSDRKVYDVSVSELDDLEAGKVKYRWESFYDLLEWYLS